MLQALVRRAQKTRHGFTDIQRAAQEIVAANSPAATLRLARELFASEVPQARMLAAFLFGKCSARSKAALSFLRRRVSRDPDWRVQEILAKAFDQYCQDRGYASARPVIEQWLVDPNPTVRRAVTEGLRIWTARDYFRERPQAAIRLLSRLRADESTYVRRSAGNALRDISRKHPELIAAELARWELSDVRVRQTHALAGKFLK